MPTPDRDDAPESAPAGAENSHTGVDRRADHAALDSRLSAVERTLSGEAAPDDLLDSAATAERLDAVEAEAAGLADRVTELEAAVQALRGYVGAVRAVNRDVERRADLALATAERLTDATGADAVDDADLAEAAGTDTGERGSDDPGVSGERRDGLAARLRDAL
ncbi:DUF7310 family coiled-coil domain-containing protein [Halobaculum sp. D14]|uniref:DUF7310 family coiled-coil domain-containing protein n=1 Tax=Halobaculum sp. D14 TaxID=3421642 RepID=UPI003EBE5080